MIYLFLFHCNRLSLRDFNVLICDRNKINLSEISHDSAMGLVFRVLNIGVLLTEVNCSEAFCFHCYRANSDQSLLFKRFVSIQLSE